MNSSIVVLISAYLAACTFAQTNGTAGFLRPIDESLFHSCGQVEEAAREYGRQIPDRIYVMELLPKNRGTLFSPFLSDGDEVRSAMAWMGRHQPPGPPYALFYSVDGAYTLRCRDDQNHFVETTGPSGSSLQWKLASGQVTLWHIYPISINSVRVFAVVDFPLDEVVGEKLLTEVKERLHAKFVFLYIRNDPWFLESSPDPLPYIFTDSFTRVTEEEFRATRTIACTPFQSQKCHLE